MKLKWYIRLIFIATIVLATKVEGDYSISLKVINSDGTPIPEFEIRAYSHEHGFYPWMKGKDGKILLRSKDDFLFSGRASHYQLIIRAAGFALSIIEMDRPDCDIEQTVRLTKGRCIELLLTTKNGRSIPETLAPMVMFPDFQNRAWLSFQLQGKSEFDFNFISLSKIKPGHYSFYIAEDSPEIYVFLDHPGFMRAFRAGPFGTEELADDKLEIELPEPAELEIAVKPPKETFEKPPYDVWSIGIDRQSPDDETIVYPLARIKSDNIDMSIDKYFLAPGNYWIKFRTRPADSSVSFESGRVNPAYYRDMKKFSFVPGQHEKVIFRYASYNENSHKGDYSCTINTRWHNGKPAAGLPYELYYEDRHFGSINIKEGTIADNGIIKIADIAGGDENNFTLEIDKGKLGRYFFQLPGKEKSRQLQYKIAPMEGNKAPDITVCDIFTGKEVKLSDFNNNVLFVEFWATWCGPCQEPMAHLCEIASNRKTDWRDKAMLLCLSLDDKKEDVKQYVSNRGWLGVRHLWCQESEPGFESLAAKTYGITSVPTALLIDQSGIIIWQGHPGAFDIEANIDKLLTNR